MPAVRWTLRVVKFTRVSQMRFAEPCGP